MPKLLWPWGDGKVMRHRVDIDHYWFNREATHSSLMLPFSFSPEQHSTIMLHMPVVRTRLMRQCEGLRDVAKCLWRADREEKGNRDKNRLGRKLRKDWRRRDGSGKVHKNTGKGWIKGSWCEGKLYLNCRQGYIAVVLGPWGGGRICSLTALLFRRAGFTVIPARHCH